MEGWRWKHIKVWKDNWIENPPRPARPRALIANDQLVVSGLVKQNQRACMEHKKDLSSNSHGRCPINNSHTAKNHKLPGLSQPGSLQEMDVIHVSLDTINFKS